MQVLIAKHGGFCFGVSRAIALAGEAAKTESRVFTYGNLIHNERVVDELKAQGIAPVESLDDLRPGDTLVIRAHGAPPEIARQCGERGVRVIDATCPFVRRIHRIVERAAAEGQFVVILGKPSHP